MEDGCRAIIDSVGVHSKWGVWPWLDTVPRSDYCVEAFGKCGMCFIVR